MTLTEIRETLLRQHGELRELAKRVSESASELAASKGAPDRLRESVRALVSALEKHNADEEHLLGGIIASVDAWGPVRKTLMEEHHAAEHRASVEAWLEVGTLNDLDEAMKRVADLVKELVQHIEREDREILHPSVLHDDIFAVDTFGG